MFRFMIILLPVNTTWAQAADDEGGQTLTPAEDFEMPPAVDLGTLEAWVHKNAHIPKQGRCTIYEAPEEEGEGEEEEAPEEEEEAKEGEEGEKDEDEEPEEPEEEPGSLRTLDQDKELADGVKAWSVTYSSSIKGLKHQVVCLRSHLWPGAFCVATPTGFSNIYVGYGLKNEAFKPTMPPPVQKEYAGEMVEATDLPPKPEPLKEEEGEEKAGSEEEGEEEEEEEEE
jgi:hypothetical protein